MPVSYGEVAASGYRPPRNDTRFVVGASSQLTLVSLRAKRSERGNLQLAKTHSCHTVSGSFLNKVTGRLPRRRKSTQRLATTRVLVLRRHRSTPLVSLRAKRSERGNLQLAKMAELPRYFGALPEQRDREVATPPVKASGVSQRHAIYCSNTISMIKKSKIPTKSGYINRSFTIQYS